MKPHRSLLLHKSRLILAAALAGGSLFGACEIRLHDAIVGGTKEYLGSLFSPGNIPQFLFPESGNASDTTTAP